MYGWEQKSDAFIWASHIYALNIDFLSHFILKRKTVCPCLIFFTTLSAREPWKQMNVRGASVNTREYFLWRNHGKVSIHDFRLSSNKKIYFCIDLMLGFMISLNLHKKKYVRFRGFLRGVVR